MVPRAFAARFERGAILFLLALALTSAPGAALPWDEPVPVPASEAPLARDPFGGVVAGIRAMSEAELKVFYLRCSRESLRGRLGSGEIALCSTGYERLLQRVFGGDFLALLAWRRNLARVDTSLASPF